MKSKITLLIPTSLGLYAPSTKLIERTLTSTKEKLLFNGEIQCIVHCDLWDNSVKTKKYLKNLQSLRDSYSFKLIYGSRGLSCATREMMALINSEYYIFLEHDWEFLKTIDLDAIVSMMDENKYVNYIRFNKRSNEIRGCDSVLEPLCLNGINLLANDNWSANPHIGRVENFKADWMKFIPDKPEKGNLMEIFICNAYRDEIKAHGFRKSLEHWGVFVYGCIGDEMTVRHLDGSGSLRAKIKKIRRNIVGSK